MLMDVTRRESLDRCLSGQLLFTCHSLKGTLCAGSSGFPFLVSCTCQSFLFAANISMISVPNFSAEKNRSLILGESRGESGAKVRRLFQTHQIFRRFFSKKTTFLGFQPRYLINKCIKTGWDLVSLMENFSPPKPSKSIKGHQTLMAEKKFDEF